jgi:serine/tyrosine/threonine adenylyltransferase
MTIFFREISKMNDESFSLFVDMLKSASYLDGNGIEAFHSEWTPWHEAWTKMINEEGVERNERQSKMQAINPKYVLRNYMAQLAIDKAELGDNSLVEELYQVLQRPYDEQPQYEKWFAKRPEWARNRVGCSMLSCSS